MMSKPLAVETSQRIWYVHLDRNYSIENLSDFGGTTELNVP